VLMLNLYSKKGQEKALPIIYVKMHGDKKSILQKSMAAKGFY